MSDELKPSVVPPRPAVRRPFVILGVIFVGALVALYLLLVLVGGMGWDGY